MKLGPLVIFWRIDSFLEDVDLGLFLKLAISVVFVLDTSGFSRERVLSALTLKSK